MKLINTTTKSLGALFFLMLSSMAYAHPGHETSISFMSGILHPFSGLDHLLVILLVGFWSAFVLKQIWVGPLAFLLGMMMGVFAGMLGAPLEFFEFGIATSVIGIGTLLLSKKQYSINWILALLAIFGLFHGFAHAQLFSQGNLGFVLVAQDMAGLVLATGALHLAGALLVGALKQKTSLFAKGAGIVSLIYGLGLVGQLSLAVIGGASV
jgi:urease accessory protein